MRIVVRIDRLGFKTCDGALPPKLQFLQSNNQIINLTSNRNNFLNRPRDIPNNVPRQIMKIEKELVPSPQAQPGPRSPSFLDKYVFISKFFIVLGSPSVNCVFPIVF